MGIANKYNTGQSVGTFNFQIPDSHGWVRLGDLYENSDKDTVYIIMSYFINTKGKFGDSPVIATPDYLVNIPAHMTDTMKDMLNDPDVYDAINNARLGFKIYSYENSYGTNYSITFVDL